MGELGNVFDALDKGDDAGPGARRGRDLVAEVEVDPRDLGDPDGQRVLVARELMHEGQWVARAVHPNDDGDALVLHLAEGFPNGGALKLRGQGEAGHAGAAAGDLIVRVHLVKLPGARRGTLARRADTAMQGQSEGSLARSAAADPLVWLVVIGALAALAWILL